MANSAAYASLSEDAKKMMAAIYHKCGADPSKTMRLEFEPGKWVDIKLSEKWRDLGDAPGGLELTR
jgi:hypothetical protein